MQVTLSLSDDEVKFLQKLIEQHRKIETKACTMEDAIHECIRTAMFDEGEQEA